MGVAAIHLGLIGAGRWGQAYIRTVRHLEGVRLARLCSRNPESKALVDSACVITDDWRELIRARDLDGVIIATPPVLHATMAEAAVTAGLPVMVEKPLAMTVGEALHLQKIVEARGTPILVDHLHLFHPGYVALKERVEESGPVRFIKSVGGSWGPFRADVRALWDYGPHDIALCLDLLGMMPRSTKTAREAVCQTDEGYGEIVSLRLEFPGGVNVEVTVGNLMAEKKRYFAVYCTDQLFVLDDLGEHKLMQYAGSGQELLGRESEANGGGIAVRISSDLPLTRAVEAFVAGIRGGSQGMFGIGLGVNVVKVLSEAQAALEAA